MQSDGVTGPDRGDAPAMVACGTAPLVEALEACWEEARGRGLGWRRRLPARRDIDPALLGEALPRALILERTSGANARIRVAGQSLCRWAGYELRGNPVLSLFEGRSREALAPVIAAVFSEPARLDMDLGSDAGGAGRLTLLPLLGRDGLPSMAMGVITGPLAGARARLSLADGKAPCLTPVALRGWARPVASAAVPPPPPRTDQPVLRLVVDNG